MDNLTKPHNKILRIIALAALAAFGVETCLWAAPVTGGGPFCLGPVRPAERQAGDTRLRHAYPSDNPELRESLHRRLISGEMTAGEFVDEVLEFFRPQRIPMAPREITPEPDKYYAAALRVGYTPTLRGKYGSVEDRFRDFAYELIENAAGGDEVLVKHARAAADELIGRMRGRLFGPDSEPVFEMGEQPFEEIIYELVALATNKTDQCKTIKDQANENAIGVLGDVGGVAEQQRGRPEVVLSRIDNMLQAQPDPFLAAVRLSIAGNALDFADPGVREQIRAGDFDFASEVQQVFGSGRQVGSGIFDYEELRERFIQKGKALEILFTTDNAGEVIFDLPLIKMFLLSGCNVTLAGREKHAFNDVRKADLDALFEEESIRRYFRDEAGKSLLGRRNFRIISSGSAVTGTDLRRATPEFIEAWQSSDVRIAKGQGALETMRYTKLTKDIFFLLKVKNEHELHFEAANGEYAILYKAPDDTGYEVFEEIAIPSRLQVLDAGYALYLTGLSERGCRLAVVSADAVDLRNMPTDKADWADGFEGLIDKRQDSQLIKGEEVLVLEEVGDWAQIEALEQPRPDRKGVWRGYKGWVRRTALEIQEGEVQPRSYDYIDAPLDTDELRGKIVRNARWFSRMEYKWGGRSGAGVDCSGLVNLAYGMAGLVVPRDAKDQYAWSAPLDSGAQLRPGDIIYLKKIPGKGQLDHIMLYSGNNKVIDARKMGGVHFVVEQDLSYLGIEDISRLMSGNEISKGRQTIHFGSLVSVVPPASETETKALLAMRMKGIAEGKIEARRLPKGAEFHRHNIDLLLKGLPMEVSPTGMRIGQGQIGIIEYDEGQEAEMHSLMAGDCLPTLIKAKRGSRNILICAHIEYSTDIKSPPYALTSLLMYLTGTLSKNKYYAQEPIEDMEIVLNIAEGAEYPQTTRIEELLYGFRQVKAVRVFRGRNFIVDYSINDRGAVFVPNNNILSGVTKEKFLPAGFSRNTVVHLWESAGAESPDADIGRNIRAAKPPNYQAALQPSL